MKLSLIICAIAASSATAFSVSTPNRAPMTMSATSDRRAAISKIAGAAAAVIPAIANADGAVSKATIGRARGIYGGRIAELKAAVEKGDFAAVTGDKSAFILFNSGAYPGSKFKASKSTAIAQTNAIFAACRAGDKAALKSAFEAYVSTNEISLLPTVDVDGGQGYSNDYDYKARSKAGAIYVR